MMEQIDHVQYINWLAYFSVKAKFEEEEAKKAKKKKQPSMGSKRGMGR